MLTSDLDGATPWKFHVLNLKIQYPPVGKGETSELQTTNFWHPAVRFWWWFQIFSIFSPIPGEMIQFDEHIFQIC